MQNFRLEELLRYSFSGALFLLTLLALHPHPRQELAQIHGIAEATLVGGLVLLTGSLIYSIHRALIFPPVLHLVLLWFTPLHIYQYEWRLLVPYLLTELEENLDRKRLELRHKRDLRVEVLSEWGAQVHFRYCSGWAILAALCLGKYFQWMSNQLALNVCWMVSGLVCLAV